MENNLNFNESYKACYLGRITTAFGLSGLFTPPVALARLLAILGMGISAQLPGSSGPESGAWL